MRMNDSVFIYGLKCPEKGIIRYIGKSTNPKRRYNEHVSNAVIKKPENIHLNRWIAKLLRNDLVPEQVILEECTNESWKEREKYWINEYGLHNLINVHEGGIEPPNNAGYKWTLDNLKNHISTKRKGIPMNQWTDKPHPGLGKPSPCKGQKRSKEFCELMSKQKTDNNGMRGKKLPLDRINKMKKQFSKAVALIDDEGNTIREFTSVAEVNKEFNLSQGAVSRVCSGEYTHTKGYRFKYVR